MFGWLRKKAAQQSLLNVLINTKILIQASKEADALILSTGKTSPAVDKDVLSAQKWLLSDIQLALDNGANLSDVVEKIDEAKGQYLLAFGAITSGAEMAIAHVLSYVKPKP